MSEQSADELEQSVLDYVAENEPVSHEEIAEALYDDEWSCPECHRRRDEAEQFGSRVRRTLLRLFERHELRQTPEWDYEVNNHE